MLYQRKELVFVCRKKLGIYPKNKYTIFFFLKKRLNLFQYPQSNNKKKLLKHLLL